jgi:hypothetical protein
MGSPTPGQWDAFRAALLSAEDAGVFDKEPEVASPFPEGLLERYQKPVVIPATITPTEPKMSEATTVTTTKADEPKPSTKVLLGKLSGALAILCGVAHLALPAGLPDTLLKGAEFLFSTLSGLL